MFSQSYFIIKTSCKKLYGKDYTPRITSELYIYFLK